MENLRQSLAPQDTLVILLCINTKYTDDNDDKENINFSQKYIDHAVSIKKVASKWFFYDCNLGTPREYSSLDDLIDQSLSKYFLLNNNQGVLGTPYTIILTRKSHHEEALETPGK